MYPPRGGQEAPVPPSYSIRGYHQPLDMPLDACSLGFILYLGRSQKRVNRVALADSSLATSREV